MQARLGSFPWVIAMFLVCQRPAYADIKDFFQILKGARNQLGATPNTGGENATRHVVLNGIPLHLLIGRASQSPEKVISQQQQRCNRPQSGAAHVPIRKEISLDYAMMIDPTPFLHPAPLCMAYAYSGQGQTDYMVVWSDGPVPTGALLSMEGTEAPGSEAPGVPRPHGAWRSFNLAEPSAGYMIVSYLMDDPAEAAFRQTVNQLLAAGFTTDGAFAQAASKNGQLLIRLERPGQDVLVSALPRRHRTNKSLILYMARIR